MPDRPLHGRTCKTLLPHVKPCRVRSYIGPKLALDWQLSGTASGVPVRRFRKALITSIVIDRLIPGES